MDVRPSTATPLTVSISTNRQPLSANITKESQIDIGVTNYYATGSPYSGEYVITPSTTDDQNLGTKGKLMSDDIIVSKIPYYETGNESGYTVYIGNL